MEREGARERGINERETAGRRGHTREVERDEKYYGRGERKRERRNAYKEVKGR